MGQYISWFFIQFVKLLDWCPTSMKFDIDCNTENSKQSFSWESRTIVYVANHHCGMQIKTCKNEDHVGPKICIDQA
jgi:hypothetical protein